MFNLMPSNFSKSFIDFDPFKDFDEFFFAKPVKAPSSRMFGTDIRRTEKGYMLEADLPGFDKSDIDIDITDNVLTIKAEHKTEKEEKDEKTDYIRRERTYGSYCRSFDISEINTEEISAEYKNGVLTLSLPEKAPAEANSRKLTIA